MHCISRWEFEVGDHGAGILISEGAGPVGVEGPLAIEVEAELVKIDTEANGGLVRREGAEAGEKVLEGEAIGVSGRWWVVVW